MITKHNCPADCHVPRNDGGIEYLKGSPEVILSMCTHIHINNKVTKLTEKEKKKLIEENEKMA